MTVEESKVRWGVISTALIGTAKVIPAMQAAKFCDIRAIASRNLEKAEATAAELGIPTAYGSYEELLADPEIDAIYNPLPNHLHVPISIQALEAGKHVLCEKPIGLTAAEGQQLVDVAGTHPELKVMEAFMFRHHPQWQKARQLVSDGDRFELSRERVVTAFATEHTVPSIGYVVWDRRRKLKPELVGTPEDEIRERRMAGEDVTDDVEMPLVCYVGDTAPAGLDGYPPVYEARVLITEMTFFRPEHRKQKIHKFGHTHLDDILERADRFQNELIILAHFSTRYHKRQTRNAVNQKLPESLKDRVQLWL